MVTVDVTGRVIRLFEPSKDWIGQGAVAGIIFQLIDEYASVESDPAVAAQENPEAGQSQLARSFFT